MTGIVVAAIVAVLWMLAADILGIPELIAGFRSLRFW